LHQVMNGRSGCRVVEGSARFVGRKEFERFLGEGLYKKPALEQMLFQHVFSVDEPDAEPCQQQRDQGDDGKVPEDLGPESSEAPNAHGGFPLPGEWLGLYEIFSVGT
jgi:hypothetical protein